MKIPTPRTLPSEPAWPQPIDYPPLLNAEGLADLVIELCGQEADPDFVREALEWRTGTLEWIPLDNMKEGPKDRNVRSTKLEQRYAKLPLHTTPPLLVEENGEVLDGNHRFRIAKAKGAPGLWCYRLGWEPDEE